MKARIRAIEYVVPKRALSNEELVSDFPGWTGDKIENKTGIRQRWVSSKDECASDLGIAAGRKLFATGVCSPSDIDFVLFCTQSPDYYLPSTACIVQSALGIQQTAGALDFNLGCSGFVYGLGIAKGLIGTGQAQNILLITAETYTKHLHPGDKSVRAIFGDGAAATLVQAYDGEVDCLGPFVYGTDGTGAKNLIVPTGGMRQARVVTPPAIHDDSGNTRTLNHLYMNGPEIFNFTLKVVPSVFRTVLANANCSMDDIDLYVFHQANAFMLEHLRKKLNIPSEKFVISMRDFGNTVSSTIPIALREAVRERRLVNGNRIMLVGFGVGYSWAAALAQWQGDRDCTDSRAVD